MRDFLEQARRRVHVVHDRHHRLQQRHVLGPNHQRHTLIDFSEIGLGDDDGDFHEGIALQIEPGHFAIDPHNAVVGSISHRVTVPRGGRLGAGAYRPACGG